MAESRIYEGNGHRATIADQENITRDECLALAHCGKDAWNTWRREFPPIEQPNAAPYLNRADFSTQDLSATNINFSGFDFGDNASFVHAKFGNRSSLFTESQFGVSTSFAAASFLGGAWFKGATFRGFTSFDWTNFQGLAVFENIEANGGISFEGSLFAGQCFFREAVFRGVAIFVGASFARPTNFEQARFESGAFFMGSEWTQISRPPSSQIHLEVKALAEAIGANPTSFPRMHFGSTYFGGDTNFSGRKFSEGLSFAIAKLPSNRPSSPTVFLSAPKFHNCELHQDTDFDKASFPAASGNSDAIRAYRTLKLAFSQQQDSQEEHRFFKLEMEEEAVAEKGAKRWLYRLYKYSSDYGFRVAWPLGWFLLATTLAGMLYAVQAELKFDFNGTYLAPLVQFSFASAIPGLEKLAEPAALRLFGEVSKGIANYSLPTVLTLLAQKAISVLMLFLIGLALRNLFKMK